MKFGIAFANSGAFSNPALMGHLATTAERCGIESLWTVEHVAIPVKHLPYPSTKDGQMPGGDNVPIQDPLLPLAFAGFAMMSTWNGSWPKVFGPVQLAGFPS